MRFAEPPRAMHTTPSRPRHPRQGERGAALIVALIAVVALLGIGMVTMLSVRSDTSASGSDRFQQVAVYAAESGAYAGVDFLRSNCKTDGTFFSQFLGTSPTGITGNNVAAGASGNPFSSMPSTYYQVTIKNNATEASATVDTDGMVILHSVGYGPNNTQAVVELEVSSPPCIATTCATGDFAQRGNSSLGDSRPAVCTSTTITDQNWRATNAGSL
jgi:Tfp pilus assembly protein PilX